MTAAADRAGELRRLIMELRSDLRAVGELAAFAGTIAAGQRPEQEPDRRDQMAVALTMHHVYTATEQALLRIARTFDRMPYLGTEWHRDLLMNLATELPDVRPPVISPELRRWLDEYRGFRHVIRHGYDYELDWRRMQPLVQRLPALANQIGQELEAYVEFIQTCIAALQKD